MTLRAAAIGIIVATVAVLFATVVRLGTASEFRIVAIDAEVTDNTPRSVVDVDDCVSTAIGGTINIDIVVPEPGVPDDSGLAAYQFRLFYDPEIVHVVSDDHDMLLDQAPGSTIVPLADPKPNSNGVYFSSAVDFGPSGIEPSGSSETGPGVLGRVTLEAQQSGMTPLVIQDVILKDDSAGDIQVDSVQGARIHVGQSCPGLPATATPTPVSMPTPGSDSDSTPTSTPPSSSAPTPTPQPQRGIGNVPVGTPTPAPDAAEMITAGGPPGTQASTGALPVAIGGLLAALGVASVVAGLTNSTSKG